jgi:hypothetical protein
MRAVLFFTIAVTIGATVGFVMPTSGRADAGRQKLRRRAFAWTMVVGALATIGELLYLLGHALSGLN